MAITYFGSASTPTDNGTNTGTPVAVTPPGSMATGDLVVLYGYYRGTSTISVSAAGGQTWNTIVSSTTATNPILSYFVTWCIFNGTWGANPSLAFSTSSTNTNAVMHVFRPTNSNYTWKLAYANVINDNSAPSGSFTCSCYFSNQGEFTNHSLITDSNLVSYYKLENVNDSKGSNTLTNNGSVAFNAAKFNNGGDLGASNSTKYLSRADNMGIPGKVDMSICGWFKLQNEPGTNTYFPLLNYINTTAGSQLTVGYRDNSGTKQLYLFAGDGITSVAYNITLGTNNWYHIAGVRDVTPNTGRLYLNGIEVTNKTLGTAAPSSNLFHIGANSAATQWASAILDDVLVFNRVLTNAEIYSIYTESKSYAPILAIGSFMTDDDNTWGTLTGAGFVLTGSSQYRNTSGSDTSSSYAHLINSSNEPIPIMTKNQATLGGDPYVAIGLTFYEQGPIGKTIEINQSVKRSNYY